MNKRVILNLCKGALIGVGAILPGISGGVLCVALGIYGLVMTFLAHPLTEFRRRWQELVPLLVGFGVGVLGLNNNVVWGLDIVHFVFWIGLGHAGTLISAVLLLTRQSWRSPIARGAELMTLCAVVCALCFLTVLPFFSPVLAFVRRLEEITGLSQAVFAPLFKTAAIGLLSQLAGTLCRDSGQQALGQTIEICSGFLCIYLALPLLEMVLSLLQTMIGG